MVFKWVGLSDLETGALGGDSAFSPTALWVKSANGVHPWYGPTLWEIVAWRAPVQLGILGLRWLTPWPY